MAKHIMVAEADTNAPKPLRGASDGSGYRDMARSESSAQELGRSADGKPTAGVGRDRSSEEAGNDRGAKGLYTRNVSKGIGAKPLRKRYLTKKEVREIGAKRHLANYPDIALITERLARRAKAEPKLRFADLFGWITHEQTLRCAWGRVRANGGAPGVDGETFQKVERSEGGVDGFLAALQMRISDSRLLCLIRHMLRVCVQEPNGVRISPRGRGTPQGGVISPLLANIYLHWFETIVSLTAKACGQVMSIVRYADDFVILARAWADGFLQKVEGTLEGRMELTVNRDKTKLLDLREAHATLTFLGYDFRMVRDRLFNTGKRYLTFGPSKKSMKRVREKIHAITHARNDRNPVGRVVEELNKLTKGWGAYYSVGYPTKAFQAVNGYVLRRMAQYLNRKSQRRYRLKFANTYSGELNHYGMYWLRWANVRRAA